jgi:hypothetical protein
MTPDLHAPASTPRQHTAVPAFLWYTSSINSSHSSRLDLGVYIQLKCQNTITSTEMHSAHKHTSPILATPILTARAPHHLTPDVSQVMFLSLRFMRCRPTPARIALSPTTTSTSDRIRSANPAPNVSAWHPSAAAHWQRRLPAGE